MSASITRADYRPAIRVLNAALKIATRGSKPIDGAAMMRAAERTTGSTDWGDLDFRTPLSLMEADFAETAPTSLGRAVLRSTLGKSLVNRLLVRKALARVGPTPTPAPIVVCGLHRTGTTALHWLLSAVPGHTYVPMYRLMNPVPRPWSVWEARAALTMSRFISPEFFDAHPASAVGPEECWMLLMPSFHVPDYTLHWRLPRYRAWVDKAPLDAPYREYAAALGLLSREYTGRLVQKGPAHVLAMPEMLRAMPGTTFVWTHRDPASAVGSFGTLSACHRRTVYGTFDAHAVGRETVERFSTFANRATAVRGQIPEDRLLDVQHAQITSDPVGVVRAICERVGTPFDAEAERRVIERRDQLASEQAHPHRYTLDQWGLDRAGIDKAFEPYLERHHALLGR